MNMLKGNKVLTELFYMLTENSMTLTSEQRRKTLKEYTDLVVKECEPKPTHKPANALPDGMVYLMSRGDI